MEAQPGDSDEKLNLYAEDSSRNIAVLLLTDDPKILSNAESSLKWLQDNCFDPDIIVLGHFQPNEEVQSRSERHTIFRQAFPDRPIVLPSPVAPFRCIIVNNGSCEKVQHDLRVSRIDQVAKENIFPRDAGWYPKIEIEQVECMPGPIVQDAEAMASEVIGASHGTNLNKTITAWNFTHCDANFVDSLPKSKDVITEQRDIKEVGAVLTKIFNVQASGGAQFLSVKDRRNANATVYDWREAFVNGSWLLAAETIGKTDHRFCNMLKDLYGCYGSRYSSELNKTPPFDYHTYSMQNLANTSVSLSTYNAALIHITFVM